MTPRRIAIYVRVSTIQQDTEGQIAECQAYAQRCGYEVAGIYQDKISGVTGKEDRPELSRRVVTSTGKTVLSVSESYDF